MLAKAEAVTLADLSENNERSDRAANDSTTTINRTRTTVAVERLWADTKAIHIWDWDFFDKLDMWSGLEVWRLMNLEITQLTQAEIMNLEDAVLMPKRLRILTDIPKGLAA